MHATVTTTSTTDGSLPQTWGDTTPELLATLAKKVAPFGWHVQILMTGKHNAEHESAIRALPTQVVIDHLGRIPAPNGRRTKLRVAGFW